MSFSDFYDLVIRYIPVSLLMTSVFGFLFWKADNILSDAGRKVIYEKISQTVADPTDSKLIEQISIFLHHYFSRNVPAIRFIFYVLSFSVASIIVMLGVYIAYTIRLASQLIYGGFARALFFRQLVGNGFVVVLLVNFSSFFFWQLFLGSGKGGLETSRLYVLFVLEIFLKVVLFIALTAATYVAFALYSGSFSGKPKIALASTIPTIYFALQFKNLTSVYLYSVAISSFPIFIVVFLLLMGRYPKIASVARGVLFWLPFENKPIRAFALLLGAFFVIFWFLALLILLLLGARG